MLLHDELPGWEVTDAAAAATLALSNALCSKALTDFLIAADAGHTHLHPGALSSSPTRPVVSFSVTSAETGETSFTPAEGPSVRAQELRRGAMVRGLARHIANFPSHAAVSAATAVGNLARRSGGLDLLLARKDLVCELMEDLADMADEALEGARAEALTALCNLLEDDRALRLLVGCQQALDDMVSGIAACLAPYSVREAMECSDTEAIADAAALIGRVLSNQHCEHVVLMHPDAPQIAAGLAAMVHRSADLETAQVALEALNAMLVGALQRPMLVSSIRAGALLFRLSSWLADGFDGQGHEDASAPLESSAAAATASDKDNANTLMVESVLLKVLDGLGRGDGGKVWEHLDSKRVILAATQLVYDAAARLQKEAQLCARARQAALAVGAKFR